MQANLTLTGDSSELGKWIGIGVCLYLTGVGLEHLGKGLAPIIKNVFDYLLESKKFDQQVQLSSAK